MVTAKKGLNPSYRLLRIRFGQVLHIVRGTWLFFGPFDDVFTDRQKHHVLRRGYALMRRSLTDQRWSRTCPRATRQKIKPWPRLLQAQSVEGPCTSNSCDDVDTEFPKGISVRLPVN